MTDHLAKLSEPEVAAWYGRLAKAWSKEQVNGEPALAPILLQHWLDNRDASSTFRFSAPSHLQDSPYVTDVLREHRDIFLSQRPVRSGVIAGAIIGTTTRLCTHPVDHTATLAVVA